MYCAMPYSKPPVIDDGLFPSQKPGPGRLVATVSTPDVTGRKPCSACGAAAEPAGAAELAALPQPAAAQQASMTRSRPR